MKIQTPPRRHLRSLSVLLFLAASTFLSGRAAAQTDESSALETIRASKNLPGLSVVVIKKGHVIAQGAAGVRKVGAAATLKVDDRINFGSCTKFVTATVAARLVDKGKISWTSRVRDVFPNTTGFNSAFLASRKSRASLVSAKRFSELSLTNPLA